MGKGRGQDTGDVGLSAVVPDYGECCPLHLVGDLWLAHGWLLWARIGSGQTPQRQLKLGRSICGNLAHFSASNSCDPV